MAQNQANNTTPGYASRHSSYSCGVGQRRLVVEQGFPVLGETGQPILVDDATYTSKDGSVYSQGRVVDKIALTQIGDINQLEGEGTPLRPALNPDVCQRQSRN